MKYIFYIFIFFASLFSTAQAQIYIDNQGNVYDQRENTNAKSSYTKAETKSIKKASSFDPSKLSLGGSFGLQFGDYTLINISPQVGYDFSKYFTFGGGFGYTYLKESYYRTKYKQSYLGFDLFGRFYPIPNIVLSVQPEINRMWQTTEIGSQKYSSNKAVPSVVVGAGIRYSGIIAMIQYDLVQDDNSPYGDNIFYSIGYYFNF